MAVSPKRRQAILTAHGGVCHYCGSPADSVDHIVAPCHGGTDNLGNLIPACLSCNSSKNDSRLPPDQEQRALQMAEAMRQTVLALMPVPERREKRDYRYPLMMTESMKTRLDAWRRARGIDSRSEAICIIIEETLDA
jgi:hypothetical protein